ncbi:MAG TPA: peptidylprolyl isomerase [Chitinophagales bacterium]|mgnify:CR=1 FL=1|nr:peptidylprolyl isomerase [Chitinophagales bacterium]
MTHSYKTAFRLFIALFGALLLSAFVPLTSGDPVLFTIGGDKVTKSEFLTVYDKHNAQDSARYSKKSIDEYLELFINFKLKVKEAESMGLDTLPGIKQQIADYYKQLAKTYLHDKDITDQLIQEAYQRMKTEVKTSHILIRLAEQASPDDTLKAFNKTLSVYRMLTEQGLDFAKLAEKYSEDPSVKENKGDLGYLTAFQTVYPFETAFYNTPKGKISGPVRTQYGYHLVKVDDVRPAQGSVRVAHILIKTTDKDTITQQQAAQKRALDVYNRLKKKKITFEQAALAESDDKTTAKSGGELPWFKSGKMFPEFEDAAFALKKTGEISKPVKTRIGWHIIKLLERKGIGTFDELKDELKKRIERDNRSRVSQQYFIARLKQDHQFTEFAEPKNTIINAIAKSQSIQRGQWKADSLETGINTNQALFTIIFPDTKQLKTYTIADFITFAEKNQMRARSRNTQETASRLYAIYAEEQLMAAEETTLQTKYPEFARLLKEFRDGNLLYELMTQNVWNKAMEDTSALRKFYNENSSRYVWKERVNAYIFTFNDPQTGAELRAKAQTATPQELANLETEAKSGKLQKYKVESGMYEKGQKTLLNAVNWAPGISENIDSADGNTSFVVITETLPPSPKKLEEARGYIIADFQSKLEQEWVKQLRKKYDVKINKDVLETLYKK